MSVAAGGRPPLAQRLTSRKFLMAVALVVYALAGVVSGQLSYEQAGAYITAAVAAFSASEGITDAMRERGRGG
ncbi:MAG: hypothetical protein DDT21_02419 [Syntrophomonadaceae bacterium]|nr:hypothetical protein [Bacillota bacterium]